MSSSENKKNLDTQAERLMSWCNAQGWSVGKVVKEVGSGINDQRPKFLALLTNPAIRRIVVEHKDRASRFGVAYIQTGLSMQERELVVVNSADTAQDDLMADLVAIITSFTAQIVGRRRAKRKTEQMLAAPPTPHRSALAATIRIGPIDLTRRHSNVWSAGMKIMPTTTPR